MSTPPVLKSVLKEQEAKKAFDTLVQKRADPSMLEYWLHAIGTSSDKSNKSPKVSENRRRAARLERKARMLAAEIERANQSPPILLMIMGSEIQRMIDLPKALREYANTWKTALSLRGPHGPSPRTEVIGCLLEAVKWATGREHYEQVATLLDAIDVAYGRGTGDCRWTVENLSQIMHRRRRRMTKLLRD